MMIPDTGLLFWANLHNYAVIRDASVAA